MIKVKKNIKGLPVSEYWFANRIEKSDLLKIASYRNYSGIKPQFMFQHISYTLETDLQLDWEVIFNSFKSNVRNEIRKAEKLNFSFQINALNIPEFILFYNSFAKSKRFEPLAERRLAQYNSNSLLFLSAHDKVHSELLVVHVYLIDGERARLLHSVSQIHSMEDDEKIKRTGYFNKKLHWEAILYFKSQSYSIYDWGGFSKNKKNTSLMGINAFKKSFGGVEKKVINYNSILFEIIFLLSHIKRRTMEIIKSTTQSISAKYIIRLDDACPAMHKRKWEEIERILDRFNIKPVVAVVPDNKDKNLEIDEYDPSFWNKVKMWQQKGWDIALHGYEHVYTTKNGGLVFPLDKNSEFAGISGGQQEEKIKKGIEIFNNNGIYTKIWIAPSHTFDENTLIALKKQTNIDIISDSITLFPFQSYGFKWVPQQLWDFKQRIGGIWTICLHPNTLADNRFSKMIDFLKKNQNNILKISDVKNYKKKLTLTDKIYRFFFWKKFVVVKLIKSLLSLLSK
jgi:predicted deacetylase